MSLTINLKGIDGVIADIEKAAKQSNEGIHKAIATFVKNVETGAKRDAPANEGHLRNSITGDVKGLKGSIVVRANYGAYLEFGTRKFAAAYVATLPADWQSFAATFKGKADGNFDDFVLHLVEWVKQKGLHLTTAIHDAQTGERFFVKARKSKAKKAEDADKLAYVIALKILREGIRPQPYLYPAVAKYTSQLINDVKNLYQ